MNPDEIYREIIVSLVKEGIKTGFNFLTAKFKRSEDSTSIENERMIEGRVDSNSGAQEEGTSEFASELNWNKTATLFWLGNDLMWIQDQMYRGSAPSRVLVGVNYVIEYSLKLGFDSNSLVIQNLSLIKEILERLAREESDPKFIYLIQEQYRSMSM